MAEVILEQRVTKLEELMAELTQNVRQLSQKMDLSQERIEAALAAQA